MRACAVEMRMDMRQEPFYARIYKKNAGAQDRDAEFVRAPAVEMHMEFLAFHPLPLPTYPRTLMSPWTKVWSSARVVRSCEH